MRIDSEFMRDLVYGAAVGDALGVPYEFMEQGTFKCTGMDEYGTHNQPRGTWSDDTSLMLATCASINLNENIDINDIRRRFRDWLELGSYAINHKVFDVGNATYRAITTGVGQSGKWDSGNGSLMRIAPLAATNATYEDIMDVSAITHDTRLCKKLCVYFVDILIAVHKDAEKGRQIVSQYVSDINEDNVRSGGYVQETFDAALWCYATTNNYRDCVLKAVNLGHDTDTTACVAGALAVAEYGYEGIPSEWIQDLRGKKIIDSSIM